MRLEVKEAEEVEEVKERVKGESRGARWLFRTDADNDCGLFAYAEGVVGGFIQVEGVRRVQDNVSVPLDRALSDQALRL